MRGLRCLGLWLGLAVVAVGAVWGADQPGATGSGDKPAATTVDVSPDILTLSLGYSRQAVGGNQKYFRRFVTLPSNLTAVLLDMSHPVDKHGVYAEISASNLGERSAAVQGVFADSSTGVWGSGLFRKSSRFEDYDDAAVAIRRYDFDGQVNARMMGGLLDASLFSVGYQGGAEDSAVDWQSDTWGAGFSHPMCGYVARVGFDTERFLFNGGPQLDGRWRRASLSLSPREVGNTEVQADFSAERTDLDMLGADVRSHAASLQVNRRFSDVLVGSGQVSTDSIYSTIVQNNYGRKRNAASVQGIYTGIKRTQIEGSFEDARIDFVDTFQNATSSPRWETGELKLTTRPNRKWKFTASLRNRSLKDAPPSESPATGQPGAIVVWSDTHRAKAQLSFSPSGRSGWSAWWERNRSDNDFQGQRAQVDTAAASAWVQFSPKFTGNATYMQQNFDLTGIPDTVGPLTSNARSLIFGGNYQCSAKTSVAASYAVARSTDANSLRENTLTVDLRRDIDRQNRLELGVMIDRFNDTSGTALGYSADVYRAAYSRQF